ncbi:TRAP transporter small permease [Halalkalibacter okhensis]|uniref:C4-dicarboxylate ABC transporter n=1 Tax=Halalkalibacter okhensis TaxID=333138 RepID=A0A0B0IC81_9BACI|nr:TRAP transporter small permease [Halalkalibacter okhensis]KHF38477.1 C4-dicarboxylate ABC transporter [Halalkalibacter okhensis]
MKILRKLDRVIMKIEEAILSYAIILIALMVTGNVLSRYFTGRSWAFAAEISEFAVIIATFLGISYAARKGRHISMSAFFDMAPAKTRKIMAIIIPAITAISLFLLAYYAYVYTISSFERGRTTTALLIPVYLFHLFIPIGFTLGGLQFLRNMWINIKEKDVFLATDKKDYL